jgi:2-oxoglutarate/2-oxoacid ferredoxin oxidoreductase subunit beta
LIEAAIKHGGTALLDVISPCVTFNDHPGSTKSYEYAKANDWILHQVGFIQEAEQITVDYDPGTTRDVKLPDGSHITLTKLDEDYDPTKRMNALEVCHRAREEKKIVTGLLYVNPESRAFSRQMNLVDTALSRLPESVIRPSAECLRAAMDELR